MGWGGPGPALIGASWHVPLTVVVSPAGSGTTTMFAAAPPKSKAGLMSLMTPDDTSDTLEGDSPRPRADLGSFARSA